MVSSMNITQKIVSTILISIGAGLSIWGYKRSEGPGSQLSNGLTGSHSDNVMMLYIAGSACIAVGVFINF